jgi:hypothetical protein
MVYEARFNIGDEVYAVEYDPDTQEYFVRDGVVLSVTFTDSSVVYTYAKDCEEHWAEEGNVFATRRGAELMLETNGKGGIDRESES